MKNRLVIVLNLLVSGLIVFNPILVSAQSPLSLDTGFDPNFILTDDDIFKSTAFSYERMTAFLREKGTLADAEVADIDGKVKKVPDIIWRVAMAYKINPKYLLALMQKEQSLVEDQNPSQDQFDWATGFAVCDNCSRTDPTIQEFKGFASQLEWAAKQHREKYLIQLLTRGITMAGQGPGITAKIDGREITPVNRATAMLYTYTPHIHGNLNVWRIWQRWFKISYPDGTVVRGTPSNKAYLIHFGEKRPFASRAVLASRVDTSKIITVQDTSLQTMPTGATIRFAPYSLLRNSKGGVYLLTQDDTKRPITSMKAFRKMNFNEDEVEDVDDADLAAYPNGVPITEKTTYPQGSLVKLQAKKDIWYVEDGVRQPLVSDVLRKLYFSGYRIHTLAPKTFDTLKEGQPYRLHDGELVRTSASPAVYVVENSILRPIPSFEILETVGWKKQNIIMVPPHVLSLHEIGPAFTPTVPTEVASFPSLSF